MDTNTVILVGRLTRDAEFKTASTGTNYCTFSIAVNDYSKNGEKVNFFDIALWGKQAEAVHKYLTKGKQICVSGRLEQHRWRENDGTNRSKIAVFAQNVQLLGSKNTPQDGPSPPAHDPSTTEDDDIPF